MDYLLGSVAPPCCQGIWYPRDSWRWPDHDREKGTQYFETLRTYLLNERDIPKTSQALIIHRTTLLYRLKKIQPLLDVSLDDPWQRLYLLLSLWIMKKQDKLSAP